MLSLAVKLLDLLIELTLPVFVFDGSRVERRAGPFQVGSRAIHVVKLPLQIFARGLECTAIGFQLPSRFGKLILLPFQFGFGFPQSPVIRLESVKRSILAGAPMSICERSSA